MTQSDDNKTDKSGKNKPVKSIPGKDHPLRESYSPAKDDLDSSNPPQGSQDQGGKEDSGGDKGEKK